MLEILLATRWGVLSVVLQLEKSWDRLSVNRCWEDQYRLC